MGVEHLLDPLFLFNPSCSSSSRSLLHGGDLEEGGSSGGWLQRGRGWGGQVWGKGGLAAKKRGKKGGRPLGFCGRKKRRLKCLLTLHPTAHNHFPHPRTKDQLFGQHFFGILHSTPLKKNLSSNSTTRGKTPKVPHIAPPFETWVHYWS
jgi:hypothetical protein